VPSLPVTHFWSTSGHPYPFAVGCLRSEPLPLRLGHDATCPEGKVNLCERFCASPHAQSSAPFWLADSFGSPSHYIDAMH
jgi:hypothetical protein